jgi:hypothetical protein
MNLASRKSRDAKLAAYYAAGHSLGATGAHFGLSSEGARRIVLSLNPKLIRQQGGRQGAARFGYERAPDGSLVRNEAEQNIIDCMVELRAAGASWVELTVKIYRATGMEVTPQSCARIVKDHCPPELPDAMKPRRSLTEKFPISTSDRAALRMAAGRAGVSVAAFIQAALRTYMGKEASTDSKATSRRLDKLLASDARATDKLFDETGYPWSRKGKGWGAGSVREGQA